jgi:hypothetical protein
MWVCSATNSESKPRSSIALARGPGAIPSSVTNVEIPNFMLLLNHIGNNPGREREVSRRRVTVQSLRPHGSRQRKPRDTRAEAQKRIHESIDRKSKPSTASLSTDYVIDRIKYLQNYLFLPLRSIWSILCRIFSASCRVSDIQLKALRSPGLGGQPPQRRLQAR